MTPDFWHGKRVFLTGHTGFKGSWLSLWLQNLGAELTGFALPPPTMPNLFVEASVADAMRSITGDVRNLEALHQAMQAAQPEIVIHMAAQALVRYSYENPVETYAVNVMGTVHLLEAVRRVGTVRSVVVVTSDKCYENHEWVWSYRECESMGGYDPYSNSKGCSEMVVSAYRSSYFNPNDLVMHGVGLATARAGNVIGGGDWASDRLIPDIIRAFERGVPVLIRSPRSIRPWQHVLEPLAGYLLLAERLYHGASHYSEGWNFGPADGDARPVEWIVERLCTLWGDGASWRQNVAIGPHEANYLKLDCSKAQIKLAWKPVWDLEKALIRIVSWHQAFAARKDMRSETISQINEYQQNFIH